MDCFLSMSMLKLVLAKVSSPALVMLAIWSPRLQQFLDNPRIQQGLAVGMKIERDTALAEGRAPTLALMVSSIANPFYPEFALAAEQAAPAPGARRAVPLPGMLVTPEA